MSAAEVPARLTVDNNINVEDETAAVSTPQQQQHHHRHDDITTAAAAAASHHHGPASPSSSSPVDGGGGGKADCWTCHDPVTVIVNDLVYAVPTNEILPGCTNNRCVRKNNSKSLEGKKVLLDRISMISRPGELLAIVGPSGGGKTTLLNVLAMRSPTFRIPSGRATFNGHCETKDTVRSSVNYVMAHDKLLPYLTVYETLKSAAALKLPKSSREEQIARVEDVIQNMCLTKCRDTFIGGEWRKGLSTGEMKRVAIAMELLDEPSVLILDEPTSGLDSTLSAKIIQLLVLEARKGRTIICSIHQPSSQVFEMFDQLLLISAGRVMYNGPADSALSYFSGMGYHSQKDWNPSDYLLDLISIQKPTIDDSDVNMAKQHAESVARIAQLADSWVSSPQGKALRAEIDTTEPRLAAEPRIRHNKRAGANWLGEVGTLWKRTTMNSIRNPMTAIVILLIQAMQGLILGGIFFHSSTAFSGPKPDPIFNEDFWNNQWVLAYNFGTDYALDPSQGLRPLLDMFETGVDAEGSYILFNSTSPAGAWKKPVKELVDDFSSCLYKKYDLPNRGYFPLTDLLEPPAESWDTWEERRIYANLLGLYQAFDYKYLEGENKDPVDFGPFWECNNEPNGLAVFMCMLPAARRHFNEVFVCLGLPSLPDVGRRRVLGEGEMAEMMFSQAKAMKMAEALAPIGPPPQQQQQSRRPPPPSRRHHNNSARQLDLKAAAAASSAKSTPTTTTSITTSPSQTVKESPTAAAAAAPSMRLLKSVSFSDSIGDLLKGALGPDLVALIDAATEWIDRSSKCEDAICKQLDKMYTEVASWADALVKTILSALNLSGCLFFVATILGFASYDALLTFPQERALFNRESANGLYRPSSYYFAKNIADLPFQLVPSLLMATIFYFMVGFEPTAHQFFAYFLICILTSFCAYGFGYMVSAAAPRMEIAILVAPLTLVVWLVLAGFFLRDADIPAWIGWFKYLSFYRWSFFSLVTNQFPPSGYFGTLPNNVILALAGVTYSNLGISILILVGLGLLYRCLGFVFLATTNRSVGLEA